MPTMTITTFSPSGSVVEERTEEVSAEVVNRSAIQKDIEQGLAAMQQIIDAPAVTFSNLSQAQTAVQQIQTAIKAEARQLRRLSRLALNRLDGTD